MLNYIDSFVLPVPRFHLDTYQAIVEQVAEIWKEYAAISYNEYVGDDLVLEGTRSFADVVDATADEVIIFGYVVFPSKQVRDFANEKVPNDPRMDEIVAPLTNPENLIFDASRMVYGGFKHLVQTA